MFRVLEKSGNRWKCFSDLNKHKRRTWLEKKKLCVFLQFVPHLGLLVLSISPFIHLSASYPTIDLQSFCFCPFCLYNHHYLPIYPMGLSGYLSIPQSVLYLKPALNQKWISAVTTNITFAFLFLKCIICENQSLCTTLHASCTLSPALTYSCNFFLRSMGFPRTWATRWPLTTLGSILYTCSCMMPGRKFGASKWPARRSTLT